MDNRKWREAHSDPQVLSERDELLAALENCCVELQDLLRVAPDNQTADNIDVRLTEARAAIAKVKPTP